MIPQWTITKDFFPRQDAKPGTNDNAVGIVGPSNATLSSEEIVKHKDRKKFRMLDDDRTVYYEGFAINCDFEPLDHFGMPNAGCTEIQYLENKRWVTC